MLQNLAAWAGCVAGALTEEEYRQKLTGAGFTGVEVQTSRVYDLNRLVMLAGLSAAEEWNGSITSAFVRARKPARILRVGTDYRVRPAGSGDLVPIETLLLACGLPTFSAVGGMPFSISALTRAI